MGNGLVYNIPAKLIDSYRGRDVILRSSSVREIVYSLWQTDPLAIRFVQLRSPFDDTSILEGSVEGLPIEIVLEDPDQFEYLYDFTNLLDSHPLRIAIPVERGFSKAVKLAVSLDYAVRLQIEQPDPFLLLELESVLDVYLRRSYVRQPIEFFQSLLTSFYRDEKISLWEIAEENPRQVCYVTDDGLQTISPRFVGVNLGGNPGNFVERFGQQLLAARGECYGCEFFDCCRGYFKWPNRDYSCAGIKKIFRNLQSATQEVRRDLTNYQGAGVQPRS